MPRMIAMPIKAAEKERIKLLPQAEAYGIPAGPERFAPFSLETRGSQVFLMFRNIVVGAIEEDRDTPLGLRLLDTVPVSAETAAIRAVRNAIEITTEIGRIMRQEKAKEKNPAQGILTSQSWILRGVSAEDMRDGLLGIGAMRHEGLFTSFDGYGTGQPNGITLQGRHLVSTTFQKRGDEWRAQNPDRNLSVLKEDFTREALKVGAEAFRTHQGLGDLSALRDEGLLGPHDLRSVDLMGLFSPDSTPIKKPLGSAGHAVQMGSDGRIRVLHHGVLLAWWKKGWNTMAVSSPEAIGATINQVREQMGIPLFDEATLGALITSAAITLGGADPRAFAPVTPDEIEEAVANTDFGYDI